MKTRYMKTRTLGWTVMILVACGGSCLAQDEPADKQTEETPPITAIVGGDIYTVTNGVIRGGTVLVQDGKILDVAQSLEIPDGAEVIDATGKVISPGFVAINVSGIGVRGAPQDDDKLADALDPFDRNIKYALGVGITTTCVELSEGQGRNRRRRDGEPAERFPGLEQPAGQYVSEAQLDYGDEDTSLCPCCGLPILPTEPITETPPSEEQPRKHAVLKLSYGELDSMLVNENAFYSPAPGALSGALNRHNWRRDVKQARQMVQRMQNAVSREDASGASSRDSRRSGQSGTGGRRGRRRGGGANEELMRLVRKEVALRVQANTIDEIRDMIALAEELDYDLVIEGGIEAWLVAPELGDAGVSVIYTPRQRRQAEPGREDTSGSSIESTGIFQRSGVPFATSALSSSISMNGIAGRDLTSLPLEAAFAVRGGASNETALKSLTIVPARMLGLEDRIGSIEPGKDADLLILDGPPLDYRTYVDIAMVNGQVSYDRHQDRVFPVEER